jgi:3',5'-cyclic-AMP phosphodiesterase
LSIFYRYPDNFRLEYFRSIKGARQAAPDLRIVVMADARGKDDGINEEVFRSIMKEISQLNPRPVYIVFPGDLVDGSRNLDRLRLQLEKFKSVYSDYMPIETLLPTVGNHEVSSNPEDEARERVFGDVYSEFEADEFLEGSNRTAYYVDMGNMRLIILNSYRPGEPNQITGEQLEWFEKVSSVPKEHKLVFLHSPAYPTGHHMGSALNIHPKERDRFWNVVDKNHVDIVFAGHEHNYSRRIIDQSFSSDEYVFERAVNQIVTGGAGAPLRDTYEDKRGVVVSPKAVYHYVIVDVYGDTLNITAVTLDGDIIDEFSL